MQKNKRLRLIRLITLFVSVAGLSAAVALPILTQAQPSPSNPPGTPSDSTNNPDNLTPSPSPGSGALQTPGSGSSPRPSGGMMSPTPGGGMMSPTPGGGMMSPTPRPSGGMMSPSPTPSGGGMMSPSPRPSGGMMSPTPRPGGGMMSPTPGGGMMSPTPRPSTSPTRPPTTGTPRPTPTPSPTSSQSLTQLLQAASTSGSFRTLARIVQETGVGSTLQTQGGRFTIFAPTDAAFAALPPGTLDRLLQPQNRSLLLQILGYHVVPGELRAAQLRTGGVRTLSGGIAIRVIPGRVIVNDGSVVQADILASNGVIHAVNRVLLSRPLRQRVAALR